jgi:uncharacterized protein YcfL
MKKNIIAALIICILFTGCKSESIIIEDNESDVAIIEDSESGVMTIENLDYYLALDMEVEKYALTMSSVPGLPLKVITNLYNKEIDIKLQFNCEEGEFLLWNDNSKVELIGTEYQSDFEDFKFYWTPLLDGEDNMVKDSNIVITVIDKKTEDILSKRKYLIIEEDGFYYYNDKEYEVLQ